MARSIRMFFAAFAALCGLLLYGTAALARASAGDTLACMNRTLARNALTLETAKRIQVNANLTFVTPYGEIAYIFARGDTIWARCPNLTATMAARTGASASAAAPALADAAPQAAPREAYAWLPVPAVLPAPDPLALQALTPQPTYALAPVDLGEAPLVITAPVPAKPPAWLPVAIDVIAAVALVLFITAYNQLRKEAKESSPARPAPRKPRRAKSHPPRRAKPAAKEEYAEPNLGDTILFRLNPARIEQNNFAFDIPCQLCGCREKVTRLFFFFGPAKRSIVYLGTSPWDPHNPIDALELFPQKGMRFLKEPIEHCIKTDPRAKTWLGEQFADLNSKEEEPLIIYGSTRHMTAEALEREKNRRPAPHTSWLSTEELGGLGRLEDPPPEKPTPPALALVENGTHDENETHAA